MRTDAFFWFLSTVPQVLGTMIGVLAVFVVYALDAIQRSIEWSRDDLVRTVKPLGLYLESFGLDGQLDRVKAKIDHLRQIDPNEPRLSDLEHSWKVIVNRRARRVSVTRYFIWLMGYFLVVIGASMAALPFSFSLEHMPHAAPVICVTILVALVGALVGVYIFLYDALRLLVLTNPDDSAINRKG